jgi:hypothetical protein
MTEYKEWLTKDGNKYITDCDGSVAFWAIHAEYAKPAWKPKEPIPDGACFPTDLASTDPRYVKKRADGKVVPFYVLGVYSSEDDNFWEKSEYWDDFLLDEAVRLAEEKGLDPEYTRLFILTSINELSGGSYPKKVVE